MLTNIGLVVIILGWLYQLLKIASGVKRLQPMFVILYAIGVMLLTADAFVIGLTEVALLNLISFAIAVGVISFLFKKEPKDSNKINNSTETKVVEENRNNMHHTDESPE